MVHGVQVDLVDLGQRALSLVDEQQRAIEPADQGSALVDNQPRAESASSLSLQLVIRGSMSNGQVLRLGLRLAH